MTKGLRLCINLMPSTTKTALRLALTYVVMGSAWILFSDRALALFVQDAAQLSQLQTAKGWAFVLLTGLLFFVLARGPWRVSWRYQSVTR